MNVKCELQVVATAVEKEAFSVVISGVKGYPSDAQVQNAVDVYLDNAGIGSAITNAQIDAMFE